MYKAGAGELAPWLRALGSLAEDPSSIPRTHITAHNGLKLQPQEICHPLLAPSDRRHGGGVVHKHTYREDTHVHKIIKYIFLKNVQSLGSTLKMEKWGVCVGGESSVIM